MVVSSGGVGADRFAASDAERVGRDEYRVESYEGLDAFGAFGTAWDEAVAAGPSDRAYHRHAFVGAWLEAFLPRQTFRLLVARTPSGKVAGIAPFLENRARGALRISPLANPHTPRLEWVLGSDPLGAVRALWSFLRDEVQWDVLTLTRLQRDGPTSVLLEREARRDGHRVGRYRAMNAPYLEVGAGRPAAPASPTFAATLRRRMRHLERDGAVSYRRIDGAAVERELVEFLRLEASGWKGRGASAIASDPVATAFYRALARASSREGWLVLRALDLDGEPIAMHLALLQAGVYTLLKTAYDERFARHSPGQLLCREVVAECEARGVREVDFMAPDARWKDEWRPAHRVHDLLEVYRPGLRGSALALAKFAELAPYAVRGRLRRVKRKAATAVAGWRAKPARP